MMKPMTFLKGTALAAAALAAGGCAKGGGGQAASPVAEPLFESVHERTFDPAKAGWTCVFEDEFCGTEVDTNKWYRPHFASKSARIEPDGDGHLVFHVEKNEKGLIPNAYLYSVPEYECGYYEARVRFTTGLGWWAASWIYGGSNQNPFLDGFEIDTFEDFYTRLKDGHFLKDRIAHSMHTHIGDYKSSFQLHTPVQGPVDGWHTIACRWDPLSVAFYLDGRLTGSYSAFNCAACIRPLHAVLSAERARGGAKWLGGNAVPGTEEGVYEVDWVRIWRDESAAAAAPRVAWAADVDLARVFVPTGSVESLGVVASGRDANDPVDQIYLFDNGYMVDYTTEMPCEFKVPMTEEHFAATHYGRFRGARGTRRPKFDGYPHVFVAFARTRSGRVGRTEPVYRIVAGEKPSSSPYDDIPAAIPGNLIAWRFDGGGQDRAYHRLLKKAYSQKKGNPRPEEKIDCSKSQVGVTYAGEWVNYTVDVAKAGPYVATLRYGTPIRSANEALLLVDGRLAGSFRLSAEPAGWSPTLASEAEVELPGGRHVITLLLRSQLMYSGIAFEPKGE